MEYTENITFEDYLSHSGTRGSEPLKIYEKQHSMKISTWKLKRRADGLWEEIREPKKLKKLIAIFN